MLGEPLHTNCTQGLHKTSVWMAARVHHPLFARTAKTIRVRGVAQLVAVRGAFCINRGLCVELIDRKHTHTIV